jgi:hypothetical protein
MSFSQFWGACVGQFWFWVGIVGILVAFVLGMAIGAGDAEGRAAERIRELEEENEALRNEQDEYELE